jgi:hypothetical protein
MTWRRLLVVTGLLVALLVVAGAAVLVLGARDLGAPDLRDRIGPSAPDPEAGRHDHHWPDDQPGQ